MYLAATNPRYLSISLFMEVKAIERGGRGSLKGEMRSRLGQYYQTHARDATRFAYFLTGDLAVSEDLVQEAFLKIAGRLGHLRRAEAFEAYLRRTIVNLVRMRHRRLGVERKYLERQGREPSSDRGVQAGIQSGVDDDLRDALKELPLRQRAAIGLRFYFDLPDPQIAEILGCSEGTVRSSVSRGLANLRRRIESEARKAGDPGDN